MNLSSISYNSLVYESKPFTSCFVLRQIKEESFLEDLNNLLNAGEVPNLFPLDERQEICDKMRIIDRWVNSGLFYFYLCLSTNFFVYIFIQSLPFLLIIFWLSQIFTGFPSFFCFLVIVFVNSFSFLQLKQHHVSARQRDKSKQTDGSPLSLFNLFVERTREMLHIVLAMSPIGDAFRNRLRKFPSLVNCCTIDWFQVSGHWFSSVQWLWLQMKIKIVFLYC